MRKLTRAGRKNLYAMHAGLRTHACPRDARRRLQSRTALAALMAAAERHLPQARRKELARQYRQRGLWLHRGQHRLGSGSGPAGSDEDSDSERAEPATIHELPSDVRDHVLR